MDPTEEEINGWMAESKLATEEGGVKIHPKWFETDAYGAAVEGILNSIDLGLASPSIGEGAEEDTLKELRELFFKIDPVAKREEEI